MHCINLTVLCKYHAVVMLHATPAPVEPAWRILDGQQGRLAITSHHQRLLSNADVTDISCAAVAGLLLFVQGPPGEDPDSHFSEDVVMCWFVQLLMALSHLHARHIIHRE